MTKKSSTSSNGPLYLIILGIVVIIGLVLWQGISRSVANNPGTSQTSTVERTSLAQAKQAYDNRSAIFLDVRDIEFYNESHITGSIGMPLGEIETRYRQLDSGKWIITYCT